MGHVPPGPLPHPGAGADLPRRQHRTARTGRPPDLSRRRVGDLGEGLARWYLNSCGVTVVATNVMVGRGEIDILARDGGVPISVEVRTRFGGDDPADAADPAKRIQAASLGRAVGARRFDVIGIGIDRDGFDVHWVPEAS